MVRHILPAALLLCLSPAAANAATATVEVTRFHLLAPPAPAITGASIAFEPAPTPEAAATPAAAPAPPSLQFGALAAAASGEFAKAGFKPVASGQPADYVARLSLTGTSQVVPKRSGFSIGLGGSTGGWRGGGVSGGVSFPIGSTTKTVTAAQMTVQIRRASDNSTVWEGRANSIAPGADPISAAPALLQALLKGFPGPSGQAVKVKVKTTP
ncbi:DUF4136 domain-containing protein [Sandarakinorhabdus oryzae]|uniref:DUF4136 domain-containing protein n=1 Tax=Sandarakinorhabdus oryzae TaxID=2675220 RepID=UPI0018CC4237|nr:DUF4136 domain-containing protein [Sandarakinorhabdus oryzae]